MAIDRFELLKHLDEHRSLVFNKQSRNKRPIVLKGVAISGVTEDERQTFIDVVRTISQPQLVRVVDAFEDDGRICVVEEYCEGGSVKQLASDSEELMSEDKITDMLAQIVLALAYLHKERNLFHGEIYPHNVLLCKDGSTVKLGSIGLLSRNQLPPSPISPTCTVAAPELWQSLPFTYSTDIWSLGCLLHWLCSKKDFPFGTLEEDIDKVRELVTSAEPAPITSAAFSDELKQLCYLMLHKNPEDRPTAQQLSEHPLLASKIAAFSLPKSNNEQRTNNKVQRREGDARLTSSANTSLTVEAERGSSADRPKSTYSKLSIIIEKSAEEQQVSSAATSEQTAGERHSAGSNGNNNNNNKELSPPPSTPSKNETSTAVGASATAANQPPATIATVTTAANKTTGLQKSNAAVAFNKAKTTPSKPAAKTTTLANSKVTSSSKQVQPAQATQHKIVYDKEDVIRLSIKGEFARLREIVKAGANVDILIIGDDDDGMTALHRAADSGAVGAAACLLDLGAKVDLASSERGETALYRASRACQLNMVQLLVDRGACVDAKCTVEMMTPLHVSVTYGHAIIIRFLLEVGRADSNSRNSNGHTALHIAAKYGDISAARILIDNGADLNAKDGLNEATPLHRAAAFDRVDLAKLLLESGAAIEPKTKLGQTPLHWAAENNNDCVALLLLNYNSDVNAKESHLEATALHVASSFGHLKIMRLLIDRGAE